MSAEQMLTLPDLKHAGPSLSIATSSSNSTSRTSPSRSDGTTLLLLVISLSRLIRCDHNELAQVKTEARQVLVDKHENSSDTLSFKVEAQEQEPDEGDLVQRT